MPPGNLHDWVALNLLEGVGPITLHRALARFGDPGTIAYRLSPAAWLSIRGVGPECVASVPPIAWGFPKLGPVGMGDNLTGVSCRP